MRGDGIAIAGVGILILALGVLKIVVFGGLDGLFAVAIGAVIFAAGLGQARVQPLEPMGEYEHKFSRVVRPLNTTAK